MFVIILFDEIEGHVQAEAKELSHDDGGHQGQRVRGSQGQGGHLASYGASLRKRFFSYNSCASRLVKVY